MTARQFAKRSGWFFLILGALSLTPAFTGHGYGLPELRINMSYGKFLGYLPLNLTSKLLLIGFGIAGLLTAAKKESVEDACIDYSRVVFYSMGMITTFSWFRETSTLFGLMPVFYGAGLFYGLFALLGFYFGYMTKRAQIHDDEPLKHAV